MGLFGALRGKKQDSPGQKEKEPVAATEGKYNEQCALCGADGAEKKWMGQYWHKRCLRRSKRFAKGMV